MPDVAVSLCGGLDNPDGGKELSSLLFEQTLLTFDDFVLRIRENKVKSPLILCTHTRWQLHAF